MGWLRTCTELEVQPSTKKIDKPIISLMLQKFGFSPSNTNTEIEVSAEAGQNGEVVLWSADSVKLRSTFSKRYLKTQNMVVAPERPERTKAVCVNTTYVAPAAETMWDHVNAAMHGKVLCFYATRSGEGFAHFVASQIAHLPAFHARRDASAEKVSADFVE